MAAHTYDYPSGKELARMGATWFASYAYYSYVDKNENTWASVPTCRLRISYFVYSKENHAIWLRRVLEMSDVKLEKNTMGLRSQQVKRMAKKTLETLEGGRRQF